MTLIIFEHNVLLFLSASQLHPHACSALRRFFVCFTFHTSCATSRMTDEVKRFLLFTCRLLIALLVELRGRVDWISEKSVGHWDSICVAKSTSSDLFNGNSTRQNVQTVPGIATILATRTLTRLAWIYCVTFITLSTRWELYVEAGADFLSGLLDFQPFSDLKLFQTWLLTRLKKIGLNAENTNELWK